MRAAVYSGTRNYYPRIYVALKSLIANSNVEKIYILIEDDEFPYELPEFVQTINISNQKYILPTSPNWKNRFSYMSSIRAAYCKIFPNLDRILSLDADTIVVDDISGIWDLPIYDVYFSAVPQNQGVGGRPYPYTNHGVALFNLDKLRDGKAEEVLHVLNTTEYDFIDQDVLNYQCWNHFHLMPPMYNQCRYTPESNAPKIIHFAAYEDWTEFPEYKQYDKTTIEEAMASHRKMVGDTSEPAYMVHTYPGRMWYVDGYLIPSMLKQGISLLQINVWNDSEGLGNLESCMQCFASMPNDNRATWHIQDDVVISKTFAERTRANNSGLVCGFCNESFDGDTVNYSGIVPIDYGWYSFQCNLIPNRLARKCADWYYNEVKPKDLYHEFTKDGKCDDTMWYKFACKYCQDQLVYNITPNLVDHVDYLLGGSAINQQREGQRRAYYWDEEDTIKELEAWLVKGGIDVFSDPRMSRQDVVCKRVPDSITYGTGHQEE